MGTAEYFSAAHTAPYLLRLIRHLDDVWRCARAPLSATRRARRVPSRPCPTGSPARPAPTSSSTRTTPSTGFPWGPDALARAKLLDRPIFLSIGYAACHWCHVMERESFEHEPTARLPERPFRLGQGRSRGAARPRPGLHGRGAGDDRRRRLADVGLPDARRPPVLRRHVLPRRAAARHAVVPPGPRRRRSCLARGPRRRRGRRRAAGREPRRGQPARRPAPSDPTPSLLEAADGRHRGRVRRREWRLGPARPSSRSR